jgi:transmembrane sensor
MKENKAKDLIEKYLNGTATEQEKAILNSWYNNRSNTMADEMPEPDYDLWNRKISSQLLKPGRVISGWFKYSVAAAVLILVGTGIFFYKQYDKKRDQNVITAAMDIAPGKKSATLTLANGKKIRLSDVNNGSLAKEAGVTISKTKEGELVYEIEDTDIQSNQMNTLTTAKGETYKIRLPDGSLVWLNAASSLIYPASLNRNGVRRVELRGEGYFEIAKDKKHPFVVKTVQQEVTVLGTHFNISAYPEESVTLTTLLEGSVEVANSKEQKILVPNQQSATSGNGFSVKTVETDDVIAWKNGLFVFNDESLENIMREVSRWYDIEVIYRNADKNKLFFGGISRYDHLSGILKKLELTEGVHFKLEGRRIIVSK